MQITQPDRNDPTKMRTDYLTPCSPGAAGAIEMNWMTIEPELLFEPYVTKQVRRYTHSTTREWDWETP